MSWLKRFALKYVKHAATGLPALIPALIPGLGLPLWVGVALSGAAGALLNQAQGNIPKTPPAPKP